MDGSLEGARRSYRQVTQINSHIGISKKYLKAAIIDIRVSLLLLIPNTRRQSVIAFTFCAQ